MPETKEISFTVGEQTHSIVKRVVDRVDQYDSTKEFYEVAIKSNARKLQAISGGGQQARNLILLLGKIRGVSESQPEDEARAFLLEGELAKTHPRVELTTERLETLSDLKLQSGLSRSEVIRRCILRHLNRLAHTYGVVQGWRRDEVVRTWEEVEAGLKRPRLQCYDILQRRFVDELEQTHRNIEDDLQGFERFAKEYVNGFLGSPAERLLRDDRPKRVFTNVENTIEEYTDLAVAETSTSKGIESSPEGVGADVF